MLRYPKWKLQIDGKRVKRSGNLYPSVTSDTGNRTGRKNLVKISSGFIFCHTLQKESIIKEGKLYVSKKF